MSTTVTPRSMAAIKDDVRRYTERLSINCVMASTHWYNETEAKLRAAEAELRAAQHRARATTDVAKARAKAAADAAWLDAVQDIAPRVGTRAGAR